MPDRLGSLLAAAQRLTVDLIAQEPVTVRPGQDTPGHALFVAERDGFDLLPIEEDGRIVRYVRRDELEQHVSVDGWTDMRDWSPVGLDVIHPDEIVSAASPLLDLLDRLTAERPLLFVLGAGGIDGIVTVYDLNQPAAQQFGFGLSLVVEAEVAREIERAAHLRESLARKRQHAAGEELNLEVLDRDVDELLFQLVDQLPKDRYGRAVGRARTWQCKAEQGEQVRLTGALYFDEKIGMVELMQLQDDLACRCPSLSPQTGDELLRVLREEVKELRNAVAHDNGDLTDERRISKWMRATLHLAENLASAETRSISTDPRRSVVS